MVQWVKLPLVTLTSHTGVKVGVLVTPLPIQLLANVSGKVLEDGSKYWVPATQPHYMVLNVALGFGLSQSWPLWPFGSKSVDGTSLCVSSLFKKEKGS